MYGSTSEHFFEKLGRKIWLTLACVPGYRGHIDNEEANLVARDGRSEALFGPVRTILWLKKASSINRINKSMLNNSQEWWNNSPRQIQATKFIGFQWLSKLTEHLVNQLSQNQKHTTMREGLFKGHFGINNTTFCICWIKLIGTQENHVTKSVFKFSIFSAKQM